jgi:hypothetical protein
MSTVHRLERMLHYLVQQRPMQGSLCPPHLQKVTGQSLGPNLWISHDWAGVQPTHWGAKPSQSEYVFHHKRALLQT